MAAVDPATRKRVLRVIVVSLLLDLVRFEGTWNFLAKQRPIAVPTLILESPKQISFTFILPLFPKLLEFYRDREAPSTLPDGAPTTLLQTMLSYLNRYKAAFERKIDSRYDIVLLGGAMGSLFSYVVGDPLSLAKVQSQLTICPFPGPPDSSKP
jgi:hypothetical protein